MASKLKLTELLYPTSTTPAITINADDTVTFGAPTTTITNISTTSITDSGNLTFTGTGNRIRGDFSTATIANRVAFQTSTANSATVIQAIPSGTSTQSQLEITNNSDPTNSAKAQVLCNVNESRIASAINGTGTYLPMTFYTGGSEAMRITTGQNVGIGTVAPAAKLDLYTNSAAGFHYPLFFSANNSASVKRDYLQIGFSVQQGAAGSETGGFDLKALRNNTPVYLCNYEGAAGAGTWKFYTDGTERMRIDSSGNLQVGGTSANKKLFVSDQVDRTEATAQFNIAGNAYQAYHYLDATAYYIGQNSNSRDLRMYAGSAPTTGVKLTPGATAWASTSDEREKDILETIENAATKVASLRAVIGKYKTDEEGIRRSFLIAQDVNVVLPEAVSEDASGMLSLRYTDIIPLLTAAIQEQQALIQDLTTRLNTLEGN